jgi:hypothetical protein
MADYTIASSVNIETGNKMRNIVSNRLYRFNNKLNMEKVFDEVVYPDELTMKKMDHVAVTVSDKTGHTFQPDYAEPIKSYRNLIPN